MNKTLIHLFHMNLTDPSAGYDAFKSKQPSMYSFMSQIISRGN